MTKKLTLVVFAALVLTAAILKPAHPPPAAPFVTGWEQNAVTSWQIQRSTAPGWAHP